MSVKEIFIFDNSLLLAEGAAKRFVNIVRGTISRRGRCLIALSGGSTPRHLYELLAKPPYRQRIAWSKLYLFWGDERCVPHNHPESNFQMVRESLLSKIDTLKDRAHPIPVELGPEMAAIRYEEELRSLSDENLPRLDLILLGVGADGHVASLFPTTPNLLEEERLVVPTVGPKSPHERVSLTLRVINAARNVMFLITGKDKAPTLAEVISERVDVYGQHLPASLVNLSDGHVVWLIDKASSAHLSLEGHE
jgi:6-phosphogluconolactonase